MNDNPTSPRLPFRWLDTLFIYLSPTSLRMLALGFSAGLPLLLVLGTLSFRLREAGIDRTTIGYLSWVALAYAFKWAWAPLVDSVRIFEYVGAVGSFQIPVWPIRLITLLGLATTLICFALLASADLQRLLRRRHHE